MALLVRTLNTGEVAVFNKSKRELYLVPADAAEAHKVIDVKIARQLVKNGKARYFSKRDLASISQALSEVVLLG